jgi:hypothetical protein
MPDYNPPLGDFQPPDIELPEGDEDDDQLQAAYAEGRKDEREAIAMRIEAIPAGMWSCDMNGGTVDAYIPRWKAIQAAEDA